MEVPLKTLMPCVSMAILLIDTAVRNDVVGLFIPRTSLVTNDVQFESNSVDKNIFINA